MKQLKSLTMKDARRISNKIDVCLNRILDESFPINAGNHWGMAIMLGIKDVYETGYIEGDKV